MANNGKSYLARLYGALTQGGAVAASWRDKVENDKQLVALLLEARPSYTTTMPTGQTSVVTSCAAS
jgi:hypothetical protein